MTQQELYDEVCRVLTWYENPDEYKEESAVNEMYDTLIRVQQFLSDSEVSYTDLSDKRYMNIYCEDGIHYTGDDAYKTEEEAKNSIDYDFHYFCTIPVTIPWKDTAIIKRPAYITFYRQIRINKEYKNVKFAVECNTRRELFDVMFNAKASIYIKKIRRTFNHPKNCYKIMSAKEYFNLEWC